MAAKTTTSAAPGLFNSRRGRIFIENFTAYLFLAPAGIIIFLFGLFPVAFAFFVSLHRWRRFPDRYVGLDQYVKTLGNFAYVVFFWLALALLAYALVTLWRLWKENHEDRRGMLYAIPGAAWTAAALAFVNWFFLLLPVVLDIPRQLRTVQQRRGIFIEAFFDSFRTPHVLDAADTMWLAVIAAAAITLIVMRLARTAQRGYFVVLGTMAGLAAASGYLLMRLTLSEIDAAIIAAREAGTSLPVWSHIILISLGAGLLFAAYALWQSVTATYDDRRFWALGLAVVLLAGGGYLLIAQVPSALSGASNEVRRGFGVTVMYSLGTVPLQLSIGLGLAVLLFQNIQGRSFFRVMYFMPYITPFVATSVIFTLLFSHRAGSPANQLLRTLGISSQTWLLEPRGIVRLIFGPETPGFLGGPGLALVVIILYTTWVYAGYSTVIFLAGLGTIPKELYEAARIDGASNWKVFRFVTLPLLSPTTFFLILVATIGTFQAFTQIFLLRKPGAYPAVDTINIYIYQQVRADNPDYAYGSAMAFVLFAVILTLTIVQNRIIGRRVFYG